MEMGRWRWKDGDGKMEMGRWRWEDGDGKMELYFIKSLRNQFAAVSYTYTRVDSDIWRCFDSCKKPLTRNEVAAVAIFVLQLH